MVALLQRLILNFIVLCNFECKSVELNMWLFLIDNFIMFLLVCHIVNTDYKHLS